MVWSQPDKHYFYYDDLIYLATVNSSSGYGYLASNPTADALETRTWDPTAGNYIVQTADYDVYGRVISQSVPHRDGQSAPSTTKTYDALGRPSTISPATGGQITYLYSGNSAIVTDQEQKKKQYLYNEAGKVTKVVEEDGNGNLNPDNPDYTTIYQYDPLGRLIQVTQGAQTRSYSYDSLGRKTSETNPESGTVTFVYDDNGNLTQKTDARGISTIYTYDALNRLVVIGYSDSTLWSLYSYDEYSSALIGLITNGKGRRTSAWTLAWNGQSLQLSPESVGYSWSYDPAGRVIQQVMWMDNTTYPASYSYTDVGCGCSKRDLQSITYPGGIQANYAHDSIGRLIGITGTYNGASDATYVGVTYASQSGSPSAIGYGTGMDYFTYENSGRLQSININLYNEDNTTHQTTLAYTYSQANRITQISETLNFYPYNVNHTYGYDRWGRLTSETGQFNNTWSYDRYDNLSGVANPANNRLTAFVDHYDAAGDQLWDAANSYQFDARNLITQATRRSDNATLGVYRYDALGHKVKKTWSGGSTSYIYGLNGEILVEFTGSTTTWNVYMGTRLVGKRIIMGSPSTWPRTDKVQWLHRNHREEVIYTQTWDRTVDGCYAYISGPQCITTNGNLYSGAFGQTGGGSDQYPGQKVDDQTGLKDFGARYYSLLTMRWNSADSVTAHIYDPQSLNKYAYVRNDPVNLVDPDGRDPFRITVWAPGYVDLISALLSNNSGMPFSHDPTQATNAAVAIGTATGWIGATSWNASFGAPILYPWSQQTTIGLKKAWKAVEDTQSDCNKFLTATLNNLKLTGESVVSLMIKIAQGGAIVENALPDAFGSKIYYRNGKVYITPEAMNTTYLYASLIHEAFHFFPGVDNDQLSDAMEKADGNGWGPLPGAGDERTGYVARHCGGIDGPPV